METVESINEEDVLVRKGKRLWWVVIDLVLFAALFGVIFVFISMPLSFVFEESNYKEMLTNLPVLLLSETLMLISAFLAAWIVLKVRGLPLTGLGLSMRGRWKDMGSGFLFILILYAVGFGLSLILGAVEVVGVRFQLSSLLLTLLFFFLVAVTEELIGRGFILGRMLDGGVNKFWALLLSSVIFSLMHLFNPGFAIVPFLNILLAGVFLGASYIYTRNLCFPIALHWFWNWLQGPVLGYEVSGNKFGDSLLQLQLPEANLINGGTFGFEGSILCSVLLIIGTILILRRKY